MKLAYWHASKQVVHYPPVFSNDV